jgi:hypothetical protein
MPKLVDHPLITLVLAFVLQVVASWVGDLLRRYKARQVDAEKDDFGIVLPASLTLLALIVGFAFSMAVGRYDLRKNYEEEEANAIGTEYVRAALLPDTQGAHVRELLKQYTDLRIQFYQLRNLSKIEQISAQTSDLQNGLWSAVVGPVAQQPTPPMALVMSGMNDVLNTQGYTQAAFWNRVPVGAWLLLTFVAMVCNFLLGYTRERASRVTLLTLPFILAIPFFLIADIDSPHAGLIHVVPQNLIALSHSLPGH